MKKRNYIHILMSLIVSLYVLAFALLANEPWSGQITFWFWTGLVIIGVNWLFVFWDIARDSTSSWIAILGPSFKFQTLYNVFSIAFCVVLPLLHAILRIQILFQLLFLVIGLACFFVMRTGADTVRHVEHQQNELVFPLQKVKDKFQLVLVEMHDNKDQEAVKRLNGFFDDYRYLAPCTDERAQKLDEEIYGILEDISLKGKDGLASLTDRLGGLITERKIYRSN